MAKSLPSTQSHLDIEDIVDDLVLLKSGNYALVMETSSLNFELLAEEEQDSKILAFASLLNSVNFSMQIVVRTERKDVNEYIDKLNVQMQQQISPALRRQMEIYTKFIQNLTLKTEILSKRFFVVINSNFSIAKQNSSLVDVFFPKPKKVNLAGSIEKAKDYLFPKRDFLIKQFRQMGIVAKQMSSNELIQLYYEVYDPDKVGIKKVELGDDEYTSNIISTITTEQK